MTAIVTIHQDPAPFVAVSHGATSTALIVWMHHTYSGQARSRARRIQARGRLDSGVSVPIGVGQPDGEHGALESVAFLTAALHVHGSPEPPDRLDDQRQPDPARARLLMALPLVGLDPVVLRRPAPLEDRVDV